MNGDNTMATLFGPLPRDFCLYFYFLMVINFVLLIIFIFSSLFIGLSQKKGIDYYVQVLAVASVYLVVYFQSRLMNTMCYSALE